MDFDRYKLIEQCKFYNSIISRLTVVSRKAKVIVNARQITVCLLHEETFSSFDVIITVSISRATSTFKPAL